MLTKRTRCRKVDFSDKKPQRDSGAFLNRTGNKEIHQRMMTSGRNLALLASREPERSQGNRTLGNK